MNSYRFLVDDTKHLENPTVTDPSNLCCLTTESIKGYPKFFYRLVAISFDQNQPFFSAISKNKILAYSKLKEFEEDRTTEFVSGRVENIVRKG